MSMSVLLVPLAVALCVTASETMASITNKISNPTENNASIQTRFNSADILIQTLKEHGLDIEICDSNTILVKSTGGILRYVRKNKNESFSIELMNVDKFDCLINDLNELENEYDRNVQSFTYNKVIQNLPSNMCIVENNVLDDESILLTISVQD